MTMFDTICTVQPGLDEDMSRPDINADGDLIGVNDRGECRPVQVGEPWIDFLPRYEAWLAGFDS